MSETQNYGTIVKQQRNRLGLTQKYALAAKSGGSVSHLSRIEKAQPYPSTGVLCKIATPLGLEEKELFNLAGYMPSEHSTSPDLAKHKYLPSLDILINQVIADSNRVKSIIQRLHTKS
jgi:transcriptional regulator with XRE-family HTH domain